jgi:predicted acetyltransferase
VTNYQIRPLTGDDDLDDQRDLADRAFGVPSADDRAFWIRLMRPLIAGGSGLGVFDGGRPAGAALFIDMPQWWLGRTVPMAGVCGVAIAPEDRGRGAGRALMTALLDAIAERGYPLSALYPATMPIYRSLGWELAGGRYTAAIPGEALRQFVTPEFGHGDLPELRRATIADEAEVISVVAGANESRRHCGPAAELIWLRRWLEDTRTYTYLAPDGFLAYRWDGHDIHVDLAIASSAPATRALWRLVAGNGRMAGTFTATVAPSDPFWWLTRERDSEIKWHGMWMLRVVDAPAAIAARGFPPGLSVSVPLIITDPVRPANTGGWQLTVASGKGELIPNGHVTVSARDAFTLGARGLAALYAGTPAATLRLAGLADGGTPGTDAALDAAFAATTFMYDAF